MSDYLKSWRENVPDNRTYEGGMLPEAEVIGNKNYYLANQANKAERDRTNGNMSRLSYVDKDTGELRTQNFNQSHAVSGTDPIGQFLVEGAVLGKPLGWLGGKAWKGTKYLYNKAFPKQTVNAVKYYGPTMGKTTAAKTNPNLIDFDDIIRQQMNETAKAKGLSSREFKKIGGKEYENIIFDNLQKARTDPANKGKTIVVSNAGALKRPEVFNGDMLIPSKNEFIKRQVGRGGIAEDAAKYYDDLVNIHGKGKLKVNDKYISELEGRLVSDVEPKIIPYSNVNNYKKGSYKLYERPSKLSESELNGLPKGDRNNILKVKSNYNGDKYNSPGFPKSNREIESIKDGE